eukprot:830240-Pyramimonas_sp.AAC.1
MGGVLQGSCEAPRRVAGIFDRCCAEILEAGGTPIYIRSAVGTPTGDCSTAEFADELVPRRLLEDHSVSEALEAIRLGG